MNKETKEYIRQWILKANEDIITIEKLTEDEIIAPSSICFHCQQLVEKYLKAFLIANSKDIRKTHSIEYLLEECAEIDPDFRCIDPANLSDFGVDIRYPDDIYIPSTKEAFKYKKLALDIKNLTETKINRLL